MNKEMTPKLSDIEKRKKLSEEDPEFNKYMEDGINEDDLKPLPENLRKKVEDLKRKTEEKEKGIDDQNLDFEMILTYRETKKIEEMLFNAEVEALKNNKAPENKIKKLGDDFNKYIDCMNEVFAKKGSQMSADDVYSLLPDDNLWVKYLLAIGKVILKNETN